MKKYIEKYKNSRIELTVPEIINLLLISIITIMPYIVTRGIKPTYLMGKVYYLYIIATILFVLSIRDKKIKFKNEEKIVTLFLTSILLSVLFSDFKKTALFGNYFRREGFIMLVIYVELFILSIKYLNLTDRVKKIVLFLPNLMAIYSVFEYYGIDPIKRFLRSEISDSAAMGLIGNRNFFATYILIFLILNFSLYIFKGEKRYLINSSLQFIALICSLTRGCWVAFGVVSIIGACYIYKDKTYIKRAIITFLIFSTSFVILNVTNGKIILSRANSIIENAMNLDSDSGSGRIAIWVAVGDLIKQKPIIGEGPDTLMYALSEYVPDKAELRANISIDKAHNEYLEYWASMGIMTLVLYLVIISKIGIKLFKNKNNSNFIVLFLTFIAYIVQAFFNISVVPVAPIWWIFLGYCVKCYREKDDSLLEEN